MLIKVKNKTKQKDTPKKLNWRSCSKSAVFKLKFYWSTAMPIHLHPVYVCGARAPLARPPPGRPRGDRARERLAALRAAALGWSPAALPVEARSARNGRLAPGAPTRPPGCAAAQRSAGAAPCSLGRRRRALLPGRWPTPGTAAPRRLVQGSRPRSAGPPAALSRARSPRRRPVSCVPAS